MYAPVRIGVPYPCVLYEATRIASGRASGVKPMPNNYADNKTDFHTGLVEARVTNDRYCWSAGYRWKLCYCWAKEEKETGKACPESVGEGEG